MNLLRWILPVFLIGVFWWRWKLPAGFILATGVLSEAVLLFLIPENPALPWPVHALIAGSVPLCVIFLGCMFLFFRDPERNIPSDPNTILSPADGIVRYIRSFSPDGRIDIEKKGRLIPVHDIVKSDPPVRDGLHVGIEMRVTDVHVNRIPIDGVLVRQTRYPGAFKSLRDIRAVTENERLVTRIDHPDQPVVVVQIASRLVRRIVSYCREGQFVARGQRMGAIRFGSQVDLIFPRIPGQSVLVREGQRVRAGETRIAGRPRSRMGQP